MTPANFCAAVARHEVAPGLVLEWPCRRQPGHDGDHLSDATRCVLRWGQAAQDEAEGA